MELRGLLGHHLGTVDAQEHQVRFEGYLLPRVYRYWGFCSLAQLAVGVAAADRIYARNATARM